MLKYSFLPISVRRKADFLDFLIESHRFLQGEDGEVVIIQEVVILRMYSDVGHPDVVCVLRAAQAVSPQ